ncbi:MAG: mandelate racemase/muconate lactonizing enzyme family protein [Nitrososphaerales archaeon]|nr:mandelate racemase/muconate lactonizing enzyme family protein [Nitrososphaerales archaeon]
MRLESAEAFPIRLKAEEKLRGGTFTYTHYQTVLVKAVCDGVAGWGEAMTRQEPKATALLVSHLADEFIGTDVVRPSSVWERIWKVLRVRGHTRGTDVEALSGLDIALHDCQARLAGKPLNRLLSSRVSETVTAYAGSLFESRGSLEDQVEAVMAAGLAGAKVKVGFGPSKDAQILKKVRKMMDDRMLVADANGAYDLARARKACVLFRDLRLAWFEEPLLSDDWEGYAKLGAHNPVPIGAGESWFAGDFDETIRRGLVRVLEPSVSRCGGVGTELMLGKLAARRKLGFSPMTGMNSAISLAASLHVASSTPSLGVEYNPFPNPLQTELATGLPQPKSGRLAVPPGPGIGIEVDESFVRRNVV